MNTTKVTKLIHKFADHLQCHDHDCIKTPTGVQGWDVSVLYSSDYIVLIKIEQRPRNEAPTDWVIVGYFLDGELTDLTCQEDGMLDVIPLYESVEIDQRPSKRITE